MDQLQLHDNKEEKRFEMAIDDQIVYIDYILSTDRIFFTHSGK